VTTLATVLRLLVLYGLGAAAAILFARRIGRAIPWRAALLFLLLPVLFLSPGCLRDRAPLGPDQAFLTTPAPRPPGPHGSAWLDDVVHQILPWHVAVREAFREGELPLRNRWNGCGTVLDANGQSAAFSPWTALAFPLPPLSALSLWGALRIFLALCGMWLWLTELSLSGRAALFGAIAFGLSMTMTAWIFFPLTAAVCLWPWALFLMERVDREEARRRATAGLAVVFFLWPLSGHLETAASAAAFTALWLLARAIAGDAARVRRRLLPIATAALLAIGLSAFSLLPQALAIGASNRLVLVAKPFWTSILSLVPHAPGWKNGALVLLLPRLFGDNVTVPMIPGPAGAFPEMAAGYIGIVPAALVLLLFRPGSPRPAWRKALAVPAAFGVGAAIGLWPFAEAVSSIPVLSHMFPLRYLTWFALAGSAIAAGELDRLIEDSDRRLSARIWPIAALVAVLFLVYGTWRRARGVYFEAGSLDPAREAFRLEGLALAAGLAIFAGTFGRARRLRSWGLPLLTIAAGAELFVQGTRLYRWEDPATLFPSTPLLEFLSREPRPFRIAGDGAMLFPNVNILAGVEEVRTHDATERRDYVALLDVAAGYDPAVYFKQLRDLDAPVLDFLNVRYLVAFPGRAAPSAKWRPVYAGADGVVFRNEDVLPRVFAPARVLRRASLPDRAFGKEVDWRNEAVLERGLEETGGPEGRNGSAEILDYAERTNSVSFRARVTGERGALLVASLVEDGGWRAHDESGRRIPTARVNGPFLAVAVPPGDHRVRLDYAPPGFREGVAISAASLGAAVAALAIVRKRRR
jgi:Bacterial membrane protein YfhO